MLVNTYTMVAWDSASQSQRVTVWCRAPALWRRRTHQASFGSVRVAIESAAAVNCDARSVRCRSARATWDSVQIRFWRESSMALWVVSAGRWVSAAGRACWWVTPVLSVRPWRTWTRATLTVAPAMSWHSCRIRDQIDCHLAACHATCESSCVVSCYPARWKAQTIRLVVPWINYVDIIFKNWMWFNFYFYNIFSYYNSSEHLNI